MTQEALEKELKEEKLKSIYLLYGEEVYVLETDVKKIKKIFAEKVTRNKLYRIRSRKHPESYSRIRNTLLRV